MLQSTRIRLIKPSMDLVPEVLAATHESRKELETYLAWVPSALAEPEQNMVRAIENHKRFTGEIRYYVVEQSTSSIAGAIGLLVKSTEVPFYELGYWVRSSKAGNGYISEAVSLLERYVFNDLKANRLEIRMAKCNIKSRRIAERSGYLLEAELQNERRLPSGKLSNTMVYAKCSLQ